MKNDCITKISRFAKDFRMERVRTPRQIYDATGYTDYHAQITHEDIEASLRQDLSLIDDWLAFTQDKRWTPAWGLSMQKGVKKVSVPAIVTNPPSYQWLGLTPF